MTEKQNTMAKIDYNYEIKKNTKKKSIIASQLRNWLAQNPVSINEVPKKQNTAKKLVQSNKKEIETHYVHNIAKTDNLTFHNTEAKEDLTKANDSDIVIKRCTSVFMHGNCNNGHHFVKLVHCGKEWCETCREKNSDTHIRRVTRWQPKINSLSVLGYLVITFPLDVRDLFLQNPKEMAEYRANLIRLLKRNGFEKGLSRWHWYGDCKDCKGQGCVKCENTGIDPTCKWHPHLNIIIENGYINFKDENGIIKKIRSFTFKFFRTKKIILRTEINLHYQYTKNKYKMKHINNYVNRATLVYTKKIEHIKAIKGFKNSSVWGARKFKTEGKQNQLNTILSCKCPVCIEDTGEVTKIEWYKPIHISNLKHQYSLKINYGGGVFLADKIPIPYKLELIYEQTKLFNFDSG